MISYYSHTMLRDQLKKKKKNGIMVMMVNKAMPVMGEHGSIRVADLLLSRTPTALSTCGLMVDEFGSWTR